VTPDDSMNSTSMAIYLQGLPLLLMRSNMLEVLDEDFVVIHGSSYTRGGGRGVYLMTGERVEFTSGPSRGAVYVRSGRSFLRRLSADGSEGALRCVRAPNSGR